jgi:PAS domain S-box-containing protein
LLAAGLKRARYNTRNNTKGLDVTQQVSSPGRTLWLGTLLVLAIVLAVGWWQFFTNERDKAAILAQESAQSYALLSRQILFSLDRFIQQSAQSHFVFDKQPQHDSLQRLLAQRIRSDPYLLDLLILDKRGAVIHWARNRKPPDVSDRAYFTALKEPGVMRHITPPLRSRLDSDRRWFFALSHAVRDESGALMGAGVAIIDIAALNETFGTLFSQSDRTAGLIHPSGHYILHSPDPGGAWVNQKAPAALLEQRSPLRIKADRNRPSEPQMLALQPIEGFDLLASGTVSLAPTYSTATRLGLIALGVWVVVALLGWLLMRRMARGEAAQRHHRELYETTLQRLDRLSRNLPGMLYQFQQNPDGTAFFPYSNDGVKALYGLPPESIQKEAAVLFDRIHPDDRAAVLESIDRSAKTLTLWQGEFRVIDTEGHERWLGGQATPQKLENGAVLWHGYSTEISQRKRLEGQIRTLNENLREQVENELKARLKTEQLYGAIFENSPEGVLLLDETGRFLHANRAAASMMATTPDQLKGRTLLDLSMEIQPETGLFSDRTLEQICLRARAGHTEQFEWSCQNDQGDEVILQILLARFDADQLLMMWRDISEIKQLRDEKQMQQAALIQQTKLAELGGMIGAIAHQWKQPLNAISLIAQDLADTRHYDELSVSECDRLVEKILNQVRFMSRTVDDFRNFYKPGARELPFNPKEEIEAIIGLLGVQLDRHGIHLALQADGDLVVLGKAGEFRQVVLNLINNAKEVLLERGYEKPRIDLHLHREKNRAVLSVCDNGGGIAEHLLPDKLFAPFITTKGEKGTGIGLSLSRTILQRMHGTITAENKEAGACFMIELPLLKEGGKHG